MALPAWRGRKGACSDAGLPHRRTSPGRRAGVARRRPGRARARRPGGVGAGGLRGRAGSSSPSAGSQRAAAGPEASGARCRHERPIDDEKPGGCQHCLQQRRLWRNHYRSHDGPDHHRPRASAHPPGDRRAQRSARHDRGRPAGGTRGARARQRPPRRHERALRRPHRR